MTTTLTRRPFGNMNNLEIVEAGPHHRAVLRHLFELYAHDFSPMTQSDVNERGMFTEDDFLLGWWDRYGDAFHPFLLRAGGRFAGFAWVEQGSYIRPNRDHHWLMSEFFILRKYRGRGIGEWFAAQLFARFPGVWEVGEIPENADAQAFWRKVIGRYTGGRFEEIAVHNDRWEGPVQRFDSAMRDG